MDKLVMCPTAGLDNGLLLTTLDHELIDDSVESRPLVAKTLLAGRQSAIVIVSSM